MFVGLYLSAPAMSRPPPPPQVETRCYDSLPQKAPLLPPLEWKFFRHERKFLWNKVAIGFDALFPIIECRFNFN